MRPRNRQGRYEDKRPNTIQKTVFATLASLPLLRDENIFLMDW